MTEFTVRILKPDDVTERYVNWLQDPTISRYSDNQYRSFTYCGQQEYVLSCMENPNIDLYGIFASTLHIGNILISGLMCYHKRAEVSYLIGDKNYRNRGAATFAVSEIVRKSRSVYCLNKLIAGVADQNIGSKLVLEKNGFFLEGIRKNHLYYNQSYYSQLDYGLMLNGN